MAKQGRVVEYIDAVQKYMLALTYNHTGTQFFETRPNSSMITLMETAKSIVREGLPIKCKLTTLYSKLDYIYRNLIYKLADLLGNFIRSYTLRMTIRVGLKKVSVSADIVKPKHKTLFDFNQRTPMATSSHFLYHLPSRVKMVVK